MALEEIRTVQAAGRVPIVVGGTGLYLRALMEGLADIPPVPADIRAWSRDLHAAIGSPGLHALLAERDPETAARLKPGDTQRLLRAVEVLEATGRSITAWQADPAAGPPAGLRFLPIVVDPPREALYAACDGRFDRMIELGALDEVRALMALDLPADLPVMKALGVPELSSYLAGETDLPAAAASARQSTRRYAKRQGTWFRHQLAPVHGCHVISAQYSESLKPAICNIIRKMG